MRMIASVKIDEDNLKLANDLISTRELSKIVNYCLRAYRKKLILPLEFERVLSELNVKSAVELIEYAVKKTKQYELMKKEIDNVNKGV